MNVKQSLVYLSLWSPHVNTLQCDVFAVRPLTRLPSRKSCPVIPTWSSSARPPPSARRSRTPDRPSSSSSRSCAEVHALDFSCFCNTPLLTSTSLFFSPVTVGLSGEQRFPGNSADETASCLRSGSFLLDFRSALSQCPHSADSVDVQRSVIGLTAMQTCQTRLKCVSQYFIM